MTTDEPTILATSGGWGRGARYQLTYAPLLHYAIELSGVDGRRPKVCHIDTAGGDQQWFMAWEDEAARIAGVDASHLSLFSMPNVEDIEGHLLEQDVIWVNGGSVANLLAVWRVHGLDAIMPRVWQAGVVLAGVSAGSICWHVGGTTDSYGPDLRPVTNGLAMLPYSNGVHYDGERQRRPLFHELIADKTLPAGYATDDGVGLVYRGTRFVEAVTEIPGKGAYHVERSPEGAAVETRIEPRSLL
ncbi:peptidase E [Fodinicola acaciae]|uniref:Type 1 glutamine amidotransferase-like domain-containing protein n=1 Tax=Fodinicola acaciae TaxID=2681555 RepID=UPI0013D30AB0|nr:peptidase E [Fodinicola acaciae]